MADSAGQSSGVGAAVVRDQRVRGATFEIGGVTLRGQTIVMRPFPPEAPEMDCVMGLALLRDFVVSFVL